MHIHVVPPFLPGAGPLSPLLQQPLPERAAVLRAEMAEAGVDAVFGMGQLDAGAADPLGVTETLAVADLVPGLWAIGAMDPRRGEDRDHLRAAEQQIEQGRIVALKGYLGYLHFGPEHPGYRPYYELAERHRLPVIFHTGDTWSARAKLRFAHPLLVDEVAVDHPRVNFVMAHVGNPWMVDAAEVVYKNINVWVDISGLVVGDAETFSAEEHAETLEEVRGRLQQAWRYAERPNRFLYGSDWPLAPLAAYRRWAEQAIPAEHREDVFADNARRLFRLEDR